MQTSSEITSLPPKFHITIVSLFFTMLVKNALSPSSRNVNVTNSISNGSLNLNYKRMSATTSSYEEIAKEVYKRGQKEGWTTQ